MSHLHKNYYLLSYESQYLETPKIIINSFYSFLNCLPSNYTACMFDSLAIRLPQSLKGGNLCLGGQNVKSHKEQEKNFSFYFCSFKSWTQHIKIDSLIKHLYRRNIERTQKRQHKKQQFNIFPNGFCHAKSFFHLTAVLTNIVQLQTTAFKKITLIPNYIQ